MIDRTLSCLSAVAGSALLVGAGLLAVATPAFATSYDPGCTDPLVGPTSSPYTHLTTSVAPTKGTLSVVGTYPKDNYVKYDVTLTQYLVANHFDPVVFTAKTTVLDSSGGTLGSQAATFLASSLPAGGVCVLNAAQDSVTCTFHDVADSTPSGAPPKTFSLVVKTPTAGAKIKLLSSTLWNESIHYNCKAEAPLTTLTELSNPALTPNVVDTYVPVAGAVNTGTAGGAATCVGGPNGTDPNKWVTIVKVPVAAQVGVDSNKPASEILPPGTFGNYSQIGIPGQQFAVGTHWYDPGAASKLLVITLRRDNCTIDGRGPLSDALQILKEKVYYKSDVTLANPNPQYNQLYSCFVSSGPTPGHPCIAFRKVYTRWNSPSSAYWGDHEWVIYANENGKYGN